MIHYRMNGIHAQNSLPFRLYAAMFQREIFSKLEISSLSRPSCCIYLPLEEIALLVKTNFFPGQNSSQYIYLIKKYKKNPGGIFVLSLTMARPVTACSSPTSPMILHHVPVHEGALPCYIVIELDCRILVYFSACIIFGKYLSADSIMFWWCLSYTVLQVAQRRTSFVVLS